MPDVLPAAPPAVVLPSSVQQQSDRAAALHAQAYGTQPAPETPPAPAPETPPAPAPETPPVPAPAPAPAPAPETPPAPEPPKPAKRTVPDSGEHGSFEHRYLAMKGRFDQAQTTIGSMQEQMSELGDELVRTQNELLRTRTGLPQPSTTAPKPPRAVREEDVNTYGAELVDFVQRAARDAVAPDIARVSSEVQQTNQKVTHTVHQSMYANLDQEIPEWRAINVNPRFKQWCRLPDVYSGVVRGKLLNAAFSAADAPRVVAFFQGFLAEEEATGQISAPQGEPPAVPAAPRTPAIPLESLAAPGRAKPASGSSTPPADKPVYSRAQVAAFYDNIRKGQYVGRDAERQQDEATIFAAQREGRIR